MEETKEVKQEVIDTAMEKLEEEVRDRVVEPKKIKAKCNGCKKTFEYVIFVKGETACGRCGLVSMMDIVPEKKKEEAPGEIVRKQKMMNFCKGCDVYWDPVLKLDHCPRCGITDFQKKKVLL
jgi:rRNA maturation endonuclease Nob1